MMRDGVYFRVRFKDGKMLFLHPGDADYFEKYCQRFSGEAGYIYLAPGEMEKSVAQLRFFHGVLIDAFVRLTGNADRKQIKDYLKEHFLDRDDPEEVPSLRNISVGRMATLIQRSIDHLIDQGGHLEEYEAREFGEVSKMED